MDHAHYVRTIRDLLSRDPERVRAANRILYDQAVLQVENEEAVGSLSPSEARDADFALAEAAST